jgi:hypothetical protein
VAFDRRTKQGQASIELTGADQCQAQGQSWCQLSRIALHHRLEDLHERSGRRHLGILPHQLQEQLDAVVGVGLDLVQPQGEPARVFGSALEVIDFQQAPPGIRALRIEAQGLVLGGVVDPPQPEQSFPPPDREQGPHTGRDFLDAIEVFQRLAC